MAERYYVVTELRSWDITDCGTPLRDTDIVDRLNEQDTDIDRLKAQVVQLTQQRTALDWEAAELRVALLFVWSQMKLGADGGTATFTHGELKRIGPSKISDEADAIGFAPPCKK